MERNALIQEGTEGGSDSEISRRRNITNEDGEGLSIQVQELDPMVWNPDSTDDEYEEGTRIPRQQRQPPESRRWPDYLDGPKTTSGGEFRACLACQTWTYGSPCHTPKLTNSSTGSIPPCLEVTPPRQECSAHSSRGTHPVLYHCTKPYALNKIFLCTQTSQMQDPIHKASAQNTQIF